MKQLDSLEIVGFRVFEHLKINELGQINLIVGKNSVGKTALLEAIYLYAKHDHATIWQQLYSRDEGSKNLQSAEHKLQVLRYIFSNYPTLFDGEIKCSFRIGSLNNSSHQLLAKFQWEKSTPHFTLTFNKNSVVDYLGEPQSHILPKLSPPINVYFISSNKLDNLQIKYLWGQIALSNRKKIIIDTLKMIIPDLEDISLVTNPHLGWDDTMAIKLKDQEVIFPLKHFGEGSEHLFTILLAFLNAIDGILLIDEIETGLHYSIIYRVWQILFNLAKEYNVQVFVTTHSDDCVDLFLAAAENTSLDTQIIRLENRQSKIVPILYNKEDLQIVAEGKIEVR